jgi:hypothetical protein
MKMFRIRFLVKAFALFTGVIFLNLSFLRAEVSALNLDPNNRMARNLTMLIANLMEEEEPGADEDSTFSALDFIAIHHPSIGTVDPLSDSKFGIWSHGHTRLGEFEILEPPPM